MKVYLDNTDITDRLLKLETFIRYGFDEKLQKFQQHLSSLPFDDRDAYIENILRNNPISTLIVEDDNFYYEGIVQQTIQKHKGYLELQVATTFTSNMKIQERFNSIGLYTLKQALKLIYPNSTNIQDISFYDSDGNYYVIPRDDWNWGGTIQDNSAIIDEDSPITGIKIDFNHFAIASTSNIYLYEINGNDSVTITRHWHYSPDGKSNWKIRLLWAGNDNLYFVAYNGSQLRYATANIGGSMSEIYLDSVYYSDALQTSDSFYMKQAFLTSIYHPQKGHFFYATISNAGGGASSMILVYKVGSGVYNDGMAVVASGDTLLDLNASVLVYNSGDGKLYWALGHQNKQLFVLYNFDTHTTALTPSYAFGLVKNSVQQIIRGSDGHILGWHYNGSGYYLAFFNPFNTSYYTDLNITVGDVYTIGEADYKSSSAYLNIINEGSRTDLERHALIYKNNSSISAIDYYYTGRNYKNPLREFIFKIDSPSKYIGIAWAGNHILPLPSVDIDTYYYPTIVINSDDLTKTINQLFTDIVRAGFYIVKIDSSTEIEATSLYGINLNKYKQLTDYTITKHTILLPYKYANIKAKYNQANFTNESSSAKAGFDINITTNFCSDFAIIHFAREFLNFTDGMPSTLWIKTPESLNIGDVVQFDTANNTITKGIVVAIEYGKLNKYLILGIDTVFNTNIHDVNPTPSLPLITSLTSNTDTNFHTSVGMLIMKASGTNIGGTITKVKIDIITHYSGQTKHQTMEMPVSLDGTFNLEVPYFTESRTSIDWTMQFCNESGCAYRKAYGSYDGNFTPQLDVVYAKDGRTLATGMNKSSLYPSIVPNSLMQDDDGDGYVDGWHKYDISTHTIIGKLPADTTYNITGNACAKLHTDGTANVYYVSDFIPLCNVFPSGNYWTIFIKQVHAIYQTEITKQVEVGFIFYDKNFQYIDDQVIGYYDVDTTGSKTKQWRWELNENAYYIRIYIKLLANSTSFTAYIQGLWLMRSWRQKDIYVESPQLDGDVANKYYVDVQDDSVKDYVNNRDPYAHVSTGFPEANDSNYGRIIIREWEDNQYYYNTVYILKKNSLGYYWHKLAEDKWSKSTSA